ncbi:DcaP family trimeric outer membrane transporter [Persicirhabdus sediminis]|uniref:Porin n=1 Tax=Persicirhabdus sediminis TaxID=454144 RepID=A0A8J7MB83_9BACT|nr:DcaP family trimeric outer membrane transporter [Persicirhabdus sediminis]MBK1789848.1 hypothetical protein [Persicirhabdus sediminis]
MNTIPQLRKGLCLLTIGLLAYPQLAAAATTEEELAELKATAAEMQKTIQLMNARIQDLEKKNAAMASSKPAPAPARASQPAAPKQSTPQLANKTEDLDLYQRSPSYLSLETIADGGELGHKSPVRYRHTMNDRQIAASRPEDYTLDPKYRGFIPVPNTPVLIKFNAKPRLDFTYDNNLAGSNTRFVPSKFPLEGSADYGGNGQANLNANGTQLSVDVRAPERPGNVRFYYQNDFFGDENANMRYRLQHLYGQYYGLKVGFTYSAWENPDVWPDTVDYEGPNSVIFARRPLVQYTHAFNECWNSTIGMEQPDFYVDAPKKLARMPDFAVNTRWENENFGHVQLSGIIRDIGARDVNGDDFHELGWGINLGTNINLTECDSLQFLGVYGEGIGGMGNDTSFLNSDAGFTADGDLEALAYWSVMAGLTHRWSDRFRSTVTYGYAHLDPASGQDEQFYNFSHYASANLIWQIKPRWSLGAEGLYGYKEAQNGDSSDDHFRFQLGMVYSLFD